MPNIQPTSPRLAEVFLIFLQLGLTSFGGPVAHLGYFREAFVERRQWVSEAEYADLVALCQFLPGPASSQVGIAIGRIRAGYAGGLAAWTAFTLPSVVMMLVFAYGVALWSGPQMQAALHGLKIAALAVVVQAVWNMAGKLTPDRPRRIVALLAAIVLLVVHQNLMQIAVLAVAALWGIATTRGDPVTARTTLRAGAAPAIWLGLFLILLAAFPLLWAVTGNPAINLVDKFYRTGSLVFGGGHVVLPLLQDELVAPGLIDGDKFLAGYGAAQAVPGPLFSFAAYAGAMLHHPPNGLAGALLALIGIYLPSFLLVFGALPVWQSLRHMPKLRGGLDFANAAVVGLLLAALYDPVFTSSVEAPADFALALAAGGALMLLQLPPWLVVLLCALAGFLASGGV